MTTTATEVRVSRGATNAVSDGLVVRDAADGRLLRRLDVPGYVRASGWESEDVVVLTTVDDEGRTTLVRRCSVRSGACATSLRFPWSGRVPQPVPPAPR